MYHTSKHQTLCQLLCSNKMFEKQYPHQTQHPDPSCLWRESNLPEHHSLRKNGKVYGNKTFVESISMDHLLFERLHSIDNLRLVMTL